MLCAYFLHLKKYKYIKPMKASQTKLNNIYFLAHAYVSCEVLNSDLNIFVPHEDIKHYNNKWINSIECDECKKMMVGNLVSILKNIKQSTTLEEYKKNEKITPKVKICNLEKKHRCEIDMYLVGNKNEYEDLYKEICLLQKQ